MIEKEVKILNAGNDIKERLEKKGCKLCKDEIQENLIFKSAEGSAKLRSTESLTDGKKTYELIRKFNVSDKDFKKYKIKDEQSVSLNEEQYLHYKDTLPFLGYNLMLTGIKHRVSYTLGDYLYEIDEWDKDTFPIPYLEIECLNPKKGINKGMEQIWSKKEIKKLLLCTDGICDIHDLYVKTQIHPLLKMIKNNK